MKKREIIDKPEEKILKKKGRGTERLKNRQGWLVGITVIVWVGIVAMILKVDPENLKDLIIKGSYLLPGLLIYLGTFLLLTILTLSAKRALLWSSVLMVSIYLRLGGLGNVINLILLVGMALSWEIYQKQK